MFFGGLLTGPGVISPGAALCKRPRNCLAMQHREMFANSYKWRFRADHWSNVWHNMPVLMYACFVFVGWTTFLGEEIKRYNSTRIVCINVADVCPQHISTTTIHHRIFTEETCSLPNICRPDSSTFSQIRIVSRARMESQTQMNANARAEVTINTFGEGFRLTYPCTYWPDFYRRYIPDSMKKYNHFMHK